jgi:hypothetical protein
MGIAEARAKGAMTMIVGVANAGGVLPAHWATSIVAAIEAGMDIASGLHMKLGDNTEIAAAAAKHGRHLFDVRHTNRRFATGKGTKRPGLRLLTVGTDCSAGKKYTALALEKEMRARGFDADFRATGQTGIFISGRGVAIDAVVADFISGAVEWIAPAATPKDFMKPFCAGIPGQLRVCYLPKGQPRWSQPFKVRGLEPGVRYSADIYRDGAKADWKTRPDDLEVEQRTVASTDTLDLALARSGGMAIRFRPVIETGKVQ